MTLQFYFTTPVPTLFIYVQVDQWKVYWTGTHKLPFALVFGGSTHLRVHSKCHLLKPEGSNGGGNGWPHFSLQWRTRGTRR